jgi:hypothetical protein
MISYDSTADTLAHIRSVNAHMIRFGTTLLNRAIHHDQSKLESPEKEIFDKYTPILKELEYGSEAYKENLEKLKPALDHHYFVNSHHPQHYNNGINGMTLHDLVEMYCDWLAAVERTKNGAFEKSLKINEERFQMSEQLVSIFRNTYEQSIPNHDDVY